MLSKDFNITILNKIVRRAFYNVRLDSGEKIKKPKLSAANIKVRYNFAQKYKNQIEKDQKHVIWSDESKINRFYSDRRSWYQKREGESLKPYHYK